MSIEDVLSGEVEVDFKGVRKWKYADPFQQFRYMSLEELENYFGEYLKEMEDIMKDMEG